jgi:hypothetical protein
MVHGQDPAPGCIVLGPVLVGEVSLRLQDEGPPVGGAGQEVRHVDVGFSLVLIADYQPEPIVPGIEPDALRLFEPQGRGLLPCLRVEDDLVDVALLRPDATADRQEVHVGRTADRLIAIEDR